MLQKVKPSEFIDVFLHAKIKFPEFVGLYEERLDWDFYLTEDKLSGFAITKERELTHLFNTNPDYKFLNDPEVVNFINENVDWFVCLGYYEYVTDGELCSVNKKSITDYYTDKLNFDVFGETNEDVEDMEKTIGLIHTAGFVKKYGIPFQTFLLNRNYPILNPGYYGNNGYDSAKKNILLYTGMSKEAE